MACVLLYWGGGYTYQELGARFGVSRDRARQLAMAGEQLIRRRFPELMFATQSPSHPFTQE